VSDLELTIDVAATPAAVWAAISDPDRIPEWLTVHDGFEDVPQELDEGAELRQHVAVGDVGSELRWTVERSEPERRLVLRGDARKGVSVRVEILLEPDGETTRIVSATDYDLPGGPVGRIAGKVVEPKAREEAWSSLERLRALVEPG
jgi:carbon monoxide dehydrogenase subunit G